MYQYKNPLDMGYEKIKIPRKQFNELFPKRKNNLFRKTEIYYNENGILLQHFVTIPVKIITCLLFPFYVLINIIGVKETIKDVRGLFFQKKYGNFRSDMVMKNSVSFKLIKDLTKKE